MLNFHYLNKAENRAEHSERQVGKLQFDVDKLEGTAMNFSFDILNLAA